MQLIRREEVEGVVRKKVRSVGLLRWQLAEQISHLHVLRLHSPLSTLHSPLSTLLFLLSTAQYNKHAPGPSHF
ncbi:hypothetical protein VNO78_08343 [Psophocarpus tetragonolobus]|uniref:Uncharacterized protein n=1 Tax=Psophocarpus tetragonolobus TaxID=3891 RepID=A0AAN9T528_PSOTE